MNAAFKIRLATPGDTLTLHELIHASVRGLQSHDYSHAQLDAALDTVYGVDSQLIADGTYFTVEVSAPSNNEDAPLIVGCGGWSKRKTLYGGDIWTAREDTLLDPKTSSAKIRAFFVHPEWARHGIGALILDACESAAKSAGFSRLEMGATLTGVPFYEAKGYTKLEPLEVPLRDGLSLLIVRMAKEI
jgi:GNAT superfamily N-acetyltransferase